MSQRPRILMLMTQLGYGGAETSFIRVSNYLAQTMDVTVALFTPTYGAVDYSAGHETLNAKLVLIDRPEKSPRLVRWWRRVVTVRQLKRTHDVTISFLSGPNLVNTLAGRRSRSIISLRGSRRYDPLVKGLRRMLFMYLVDPITYLFAKWIVPVSSGLIHELPWWVNRTRVVSISAFIDHEVLASRLAEPIPTNYAILKGQPVVVVVGRLSPEKGVQHLLTVMAMLSSQHPGVKLLLVGDGPSASTLRAQAEKLGFALDDMTPGTPAVIFAGYQKNVMPLITLGRVLALPSATEGFPSVLLEGIAAGVPVVANDAPWGARAILEVEPTTQRPYACTQITQTPYGTLMPRIDDAVHHRFWAQQLLQHLNAPSAPSAAAKTRLDTFSIEHVGARWRQLIERAMQL